VLGAPPRLSRNICWVTVGVRLCPCPFHALPDYTKGKQSVLTVNSDSFKFWVTQTSLLSWTVSPTPDSCPPVLWFGCGLFPKESCSGSLSPNVTVLKGGRIFKRWVPVGVTGSWLPHEEINADLLGWVRCHSGLAQDKAGCYKRTSLVHPWKQAPLLPFSPCELSHTCSCHEMPSAMVWHSQDPVQTLTPYYLDIPITRITSQINLFSLYITQLQVIC
jgi:hypothetical protein